MAATLVFNEKARRTVEPSCTICREPGSAELRERWGCDGSPPQDPLGPFDCWVCETMPPAARERCPKCEGTGRWFAPTCPWQMVGPREHFVCQAVAHQESHLPYAGGWADLPATLVEAMGIVGKERAKIRERELEGD